MEILDSLKKICEIVYGSPVLNGFAKTRKINSGGKENFDIYGNSSFLRGYSSIVSRRVSSPGSKDFVPGASVRTEVAWGGPSWNGECPLRGWEVYCRVEDRDAIAEAKFDHSFSTSPSDKFFLDLYFETHNTSDTSKIVEKFDLKDWEVEYFHTGKELSYLSWDGPMCEEGTYYNESGLSLADIVRIANNPLSVNRVRNELRKEFCAIGKERVVPENKHFNYKIVPMIYIGPSAKMGRRVDFRFRASTKVPCSLFDISDISKNIDDFSDNILN